MGACFGMFKKRPKTDRLIRRCIYHHDQDKVELELLVDGGTDGCTDEDSMDADVWTTSRGDLALVSAGKLKSKPSRLDYDDYRSAKARNTEQVDQVSESHHMLALDAYNLLASRALQKRTTSCCSSTPPSSIDLEWEVESVLQPVNARPKSLPSSHVDDGGSSYSGGPGGSPESLEWDPCEQNATDFETEQLIHEIEILTRRALQETGDWTKTGS